MPLDHLGWCMAEYNTYFGHIGYTFHTGELMCTFCPV